MTATDGRLRFGKDGLRACELSDQALWDEVRRRRRARGQGAVLESRDRASAGTASAPSLGHRTKQSVAQWYANLELEPGASLSKVREAYERLSHQFRPEQHEGDAEKYSAAKELTKSLNHAYESLSAYLNREPR